LTIFSTVFHAIIKKMLKPITTVWCVLPLMLPPTDPDPFLAAYSPPDSAPGRWRASCWFGSGAPAGSSPASAPSANSSASRWCPVEISTTDCPRCYYFRPRALFPELCARWTVPQLWSFVEKGFRSRGEVCR